MPTEITSLSELDTYLSASKEKISVIKFEASWCGPCHAIAPVFNALAEQYKNVNFFKVDVDRSKEVAQQYSVTAMPTFVFLKGSTKVDQVRGANKAALQSTLSRYASPSAASASAFSGKGHTLGGGGSGITSASIKREVGTSFPIDPQVQVLLLLLGGYFVLWWLSAQ